MAPRSPCPDCLRVPVPWRVSPAMRGFLFFLLLSLAASQARAGVIPADLEKQEDDITVIERSRRLLTAKIDRGDPASAREVLAFLRLRIDGKRYAVFSDVEMTLLGAWLGDFDFLHRMRGKPLDGADADADEPSCCGR